MGLGMDSVRANAAWAACNALKRAGVSQGEIDYVTKNINAWVEAAYGQGKIDMYEVCSKSLSERHENPEKVLPAS